MSHEHHHSHEHSHGHSHENPLRAFASEFASGILLIAGVILSHSGIAKLSLSEILIPAVFIIATIPVAIPILADAWREWRKGSFMNEFTLMLVAAAGAFLIGEYPEAVAVLLFYSFGEKLEHRASDDVKNRIRGLIGRLPEKASVIGPDGKITEKSPTDVLPGSRIMVKPGERVPLDGKLAGDSDISFDTSAMTGESVPRAYSPGDEIPSGIIPVDRAAELVTTAKFSDSSMSRMLRLIEDAAAKKSPAESMLRRITRWYTPVVFILALLLFIVPWIVSVCGGPAFSWEIWFNRSLIFLVCSCPCALVVSVPLSYFASMGTASRMGLLFKDSAHIDAVRKADTVFFDKTGTLTTGMFHVVEVKAAPEHTQTEVLQVTGSLDYGSAHPLAKALESYCSDNSIDVRTDAGAVTVAHGITGEYEGKKALAGSRKLMENEDISVAEAQLPYTEICVALGGKYIGSVYLEDTLKPEARKAIADLHRLGVKEVVILSGDREQAVANTAKESGADRFAASLLPADKQRIIEQSRANGHRVIFVGDGINDAPAITSADTGVAMGTHGTDIAMESADIVVAGDNLSTLPDAIRLSRRVKNVVTENVTFALGVKALVMILGACGIASLWAAVFADTGVTLITILWTIICLNLKTKRKR